MWIPSIIFRPVFWLTVLLLITPALSIMCVQCTPGPAGCDNEPATACDAQFDVCNTKVDKNGRSQDRQCLTLGQMIGNMTIALGCQPGRHSVEWCACDKDNCNSGDVPTLKKAAADAAGTSSSNNNNAGGKGDASSFLKGKSKVLIWTGVFLAGSGFIPRLIY